LATSFIGNSAYDSEELIAYELGYRTHLFNSVSFDLTGFYNHYNNLRSFAPGPPELETSPSPSHIIIPLRVVNEAQAHSYGIELAASWRVNDYWKLDLGYSYFNIDFDTPNNILLLDSLENNPPNHLLSLRSLWTIRPDLNLNLWLRYSDALGSADAIDSFVTLDARLAWQATNNLELSLIGQNLLEDSRPEGQLQFSNSPPPLEIERSFFVKFSLLF
jgi:iron complex outermembrane receptor protein